MSNQPSLRERLHQVFEHWRYRHGPKAVDRLVAATTWQATAKLKRSGPVSILVDTNVIANGITHETAWINTGEKLWGGVHPVNTGYAARVTVFADDDASATHQNIRFLPGIVHLAKHGLMELRTSAELRAEEFHQPMGRLRGYGYFDHSLFAGVELASVDGIAFPTLGPKSLGLPNSREQQQRRIEASNDPLYQALKAEIGESNNLDAWHIRTAETHGLDYFLTMDFKLNRILKSRAHREPIASLKTKVVTPVELGAIYGLMPVPPRLFSYHNASFKVRGDLNWGIGKRNPPRHGKEPVKP